MGDMFGTLAKHYHDGGWMMHPILVSLFFVVGLVIDRIIALYFRANVDKDAFLRGLKKHIYAGDLDKAISFTASQKKTPLTSVIKAGLINVPKGDQDVQAAMDEATLRESPKIEARTGYLAMIGNVATLLGLLGTIVGLIGAFGAVANANPADKAAILADSISEAMNCTAFGLLTAIPALVAFSVLQGRTQHMIDEINETSVAVLNLIVANKDKMKMPATVSTGDDD
ncbi:MULTISPECIES: MotA/TolQ/ExbB proton channel family protein [Anaeromyxobacter]|jgi:biopolymer transport protein ExbB|uniref:MotA/TolQ/ExbB proton channel family protein n=1 Tax=Anaeromyxobacter TaxID=161492 RepID=UPI001F57B46D|nr:MULTISPECIES: MotA/TolQ/ExbB proton channel family protein [unclassified Anaeromyxobacter]